MTKYIFIILLIFVSMESNAEITYPYVAPIERELLIRSAYVKIKEGMTEQAVLNVLPKPDEILDLYEPKIKTGKVIGKTYWYIIQRMSKYGSVNEKQEKLVRISFDLESRVIKVDSWGL